MAQNPMIARIATSLANRPQTPGGIGLPPMGAPQPQPVQRTNFGGLNSPGFGGLGPIGLGGVAQGEPNPSTPAPTSGGLGGIFPGGFPGQTTTPAPPPGTVPPLPSPGTPAPTPTPGGGAPHHPMLASVFNGTAQRYDPRSDPRLVNPGAFKDGFLDNYFGGQRRMDRMYERALSLSQRPNRAGAAMDPRLKAEQDMLMAAFGFTPGPAEFTARPDGQVYADRNAMNAAYGTSTGTSARVAASPTAVPEPVNGYPTAVPPPAGAPAPYVPLRPAIDTSLQAQVDALAQPNWTRRGFTPGNGGWGSGQGYDR